jgi:membrane-bound serine protease (ClpP class)
MWNVIIFLIVVGILLLVSETFVPGGILGTIGFILVAVGIVMTYHEHGSTTGNIVLVATLVGTILLVIIGLKIFPKTRLGKMVILKTAVSKGKGYDSSVETLSGLAGKSGVVITDLRPAGIAKIDDKRVDVVSEGGYIDSGTNIKVIRIDGNKVLVVKDNINHCGGTDNG